MFNRALNILKNNSFFLFGARATGKSTYLNLLFTAGEAYRIDLLDEAQFERFLARSGELDLLCRSLPETVQWIVIDEVQKLPKLLDEVHRQLFQKRFHFALTGSSARKLKRGKANLLAGRAFTFSLFPLTHRELEDAFNLNDVLSWGTLPPLYHLTGSDDKARFLRSYTSTYLKEEVAAEQLVRGSNSFHRFLPLAGQCNGKIINYSAIARDIGVDSVTVKTYFDILEDTLLGFRLEPYHTSIRKRQRQNPKFYLFDTGVARALQGLTKQELSPRTSGYGEAFEHFIILEIQRLASYGEKDWRFSYLRSSGDAEIDLIIERPGMPLAIVEIKSGVLIDEKNINSFARLAQEFPGAEALLLCQEKHPRRVGMIEILPWREGLLRLDL